MKKIRETNEVISYELSNKTQVHVIKMEETEQTYVEMFFHVGSIDLKIKANNEIITFPEGIAHFIEHMMFHMPHGDQFSLFNKKGFSSNAMTSFERTVYMFKATENLLEGIDLLLDMVDVPYFMEDRVKLETNIIEEEIKMYNNDIKTIMYNNLLENMYYNHPIKHDIGGTISSINKINAEMLNDFYKYFYQPTNRELLICGKVNIEELEAHLEKYNNKLTHKADFEVVFDEEPDELIKQYEIVYHDVELPKMIMGVKLKSTTSVKDSIILDLFLELLFSKTSDFYEHLVNEKLINRNFFYEASYYRKIFGFLIFGETKNIEELVDKIKNAILVDNGYLNEEDFTRLKKVYQANLIYTLDHPVRLGRLYLNFKQTGIDMFKINELINTVEFSDIVNFSKTITEDNISVLIYKKA